MKRVKEAVGCLSICLLVSGCGETDTLAIADEKNLHLEVAYGEEFSYTPESLGISANDMEKISYNEIDLNALGTQKIIYQYNDQELTVEVTIVDKEPPVMSAQDITISEQELNAIDSYMQISAVDNYDGDISSSVTCDPIDVSSITAPTVLTRVCSVKDSSGNEAQTTVQINVEESSERIEVYASGVVNGLTVEPHIVENPDSITVMVNKFNALPDDYAPSDLVDIGGGYQLRQEAAVQYAAMKAQADADGIVLNVLSAYRTKSYQEGLFWNYVNIQGEEYAAVYSAVPRRSEHELGLAIDVGDNYYLDENLDHTATGIWLNENAAKYGFIMRYPEDKVLTTQYGFEAWHYRYVGAELAMKLKESNLTLEEYYQVESMEDGNSYRFY